MEIYLYRLIDEQGTSISEIAKKMGVSIQYISNVARGQRVSLKFLEKIANVIGVPAWRILCPPEDDPITQAKLLQAQKPAKAQSPWQQFSDLKKQHPDTFLIFRNGDMYEIYGKDAETAAEILGIALSSDEAGHRRISFPNKALDSLLPRIIRAGHHVGICDLMKKPK